MFNERPSILCSDAFCFYAVISKIRMVWMSSWLISEFVLDSIIVSTLRQMMTLDDLA